MALECGGRRCSNSARNLRLVEDKPSDEVQCCYGIFNRRVAGGPAAGLYNLSKMFTNTEDGSYLAAGYERKQ